MHQKNKNGDCRRKKSFPFNGLRTDFFRRYKNFFSAGYWKDVLETTCLLILFFQRNWTMFLLGIPVLWLALQRRYHQWEEEKRWRLNMEFREGMQGISAALSAGYSMENAILEAQKDLQVLYGEQSVLIPRFRAMERRLALNQPVDEVIAQFAMECQVEDINHFAEVFQTACRSGGNLILITRAASQRIGQRIEAKREIRTMLAGKQIEGKIMNMVPLGIILYFWISSPGFLDFYYKTELGRCCMIIFLACYLGAREWSRRICCISV